jgi:hypothetical protein
MRWLTLLRWLTRFREGDLLSQSFAQDEGEVFGQIGVYVGRKSGLSGTDKFLQLCRAPEHEATCPSRADRVRRRENRCRWAWITLRLGPAPGLAYSGDNMRSLVCVWSPVASKNFGDAKSKSFVCSPFVNEDVGRLQVAINNQVPMRIGDGFAHLQRKLYRLPGAALHNTHRWDRLSRTPSRETADQQHCGQHRAASRFQGVRERRESAVPSVAAHRRRCGGA